MPHLVLFLVRIGQICVYAALIALFISRWFIGFLRDAGPNGALAPTGWIILIVIGTVGGGGLLMLSAAFALLRQPEDLPPILTVRMPLSAVTRALACLAVILLAIGACGGIFGTPNETLPLALKIALVEIPLSVVIWTFYVCWFFDEQRHHAVRIYVALFDWRFAYLLIPILWPILIYKSWKWRW